MKLLKRLIKIVLVLAVILAIAGFVFVQYQKPTYKGELGLKNLQKEVKVQFDNYGVPHIYAENQHDAFTALGYVHAQDRLWQMELMRRIASGRLSEIFGTDMLKNDRFFIGLGIEEANQKTIENLDTNSKAYKLAIAYLDGVNQFIENGKTPIEFILIGVEKEKYTIKDIYNIVGYMSFSFASAHKTDPLLTKIQQTLGSEYIQELGIHPNTNSTLIKNFSGLSGLSSEVHDLMKNSPVPPFIGSNSWVIAPPKTKNKKVLFANDPHIGFAQPAVWYEAHIKTPNYEMYGYHLAGTPYPLLGHNRNFAWGLTMFQNDDMNFYVETNNPENDNEYLTKDGYKTYTTRTKTIKVKDQEDETITIKESAHGPLMNGLIEGVEIKEPLAMQWIYTQEESQIIDALYEMSHAKNFTEFEQGVAKIHAPGLNVMYGDAQDNIAWWATGKLYSLPKGKNSKLLLNGATGEEEIERFLDFSENPQAKNPSWNYVYSANNQPEAVNGTYTQGYYLPEDRAKRIVSLLEPKNDWSREDFKAMLNDVTSTKVHENLKEIGTVLNVEKLDNTAQKAWQILKGWKANFHKNEVAPVIYNKFIYTLFKNLFKDELQTDFARLMNTDASKKAMNLIVYNENSVWWDNVKTTDKKETRSEIVTQSFAQAITDLQQQFGDKINDWTWDKAHFLTHEHVVGKGVPSLASFFNVGPFAVDGNKETINNLAFAYDDSGIYNVLHGPSTRRIVDFSDVENSMSILPTGQSGNPFSAHYRDQAQMYANGEFRKMLLNPTEIENSSDNVLVLKPE